MANLWQRMLTDPHLMQLPSQRPQGVEPKVRAPQAMPADAAKAALTGKLREAMPALQDLDDDEVLNGYHQSLVEDKVIPEKSTVKDLLEAQRYHGIALKALDHYGRSGDMEQLNVPVIPEGVDQKSPRQLQGLVERHFPGLTDMEPEKVLRSAFSIARQDGSIPKDTKYQDYLDSLLGGSGEVSAKGPPGKTVKQLARGAVEAVTGIATGPVKLLQAGAMETPEAEMLRQEGTRETAMGLGAALSPGAAAALVPEVGGAAAVITARQLIAQQMLRGGTSLGIFNALTSAGEQATEMANGEVSATQAAARIGLNTAAGFAMGAVLDPVLGVFGHVSRIKNNNAVTEALARTQATESQAAAVRAFMDELTPMNLLSRFREDIAEGAARGADDETTSRVILAKLFGSTPEAVPGNIVADMAGKMGKARDVMTQAYEPRPIEIPTPIETPAVTPGLERTAPPMPQAGNAVEPNPIALPSGEPPLAVEPNRPPAPAPAPVEPPPAPPAAPEPPNILDIASQVKSEQNWTQAVRQVAEKSGAPPEDIEAALRSSSPSDLGALHSRHGLSVQEIEHLREGMPAEQVFKPAEPVPSAPPAVPAKNSYPAKVRDRLNKSATAAAKRINARRSTLFSDPVEFAKNLKDVAITLAADMFNAGTWSADWARDRLHKLYGEVVTPHVEKLIEMARKHSARLFQDEETARGRLSELMALAKSGKHGFDWYDKTSGAVHEMFDDPQDADMMLRFLAVTSANGQTEAGAALAMKAFAQWKHGLDFEGFRGPSMVGQLKRIANGESLGEHTKIENFYQALKGNPDAVVIDRWMMRALGLHERGGALREPDYRLYARFVRERAQEEGMTPRQFQAAVWEGARIAKAHETEKIGGRALTSKSGSARPLEELVHRNLGFAVDLKQWADDSKQELVGLDRIYKGMRPVREASEMTGHTFDPKKNWETDRTPGHILTLSTLVLPKNKFYPDQLLRFYKSFESIVRARSEHFSVGLFHDPENKLYSIDFNVHLPLGEKGRMQGLGAAFANRQFALGETDAAGNYLRSHETGYNPAEHGPQFTPPTEGKLKAGWFKKERARITGILNSLKERKNAPKVRSAA
jgi:hypothetical protein